MRSAAWRPPWLWHTVGRFDRPGVAGAVALVVYAAFALWHGDPGGVSPFPYYSYLADAFLHGQTNLRLSPPTLHDLSVFDGRVYLYWFPFPALVLLPFVAVWGVRFSDVGFTVVLGALNVVLVAVLLRAAVAGRWLRLDRVRRGALVLCFALGTVHLTLVPFGRVWFTGQIVGFAALALAYLAAIRSRGVAGAVLAGLALSAALATRSHLVLAGVWPVWALLSRQRTSRARLGVLAGVALPIVAVVALLALYDQVRFGSPLETGIRFHRMGGAFVETYARYGAFNLHYLPRNVFYELLTYPLMPGFESLQGGGLFWMTPVLLAAFWARSRQRGSIPAAVVSIVLTAIPIVLVMGTGYVQWGPRYSLDFMVPLLLLAGMGLRRWRPRGIAIALGLSLGIYLVGAGYLALYL
ncbi:MAG TPA: hypothetical protein VGG91_14570 [Myxococcaceae bacterium]|jgi:hypothetical protein